MTMKAMQLNSSQQEPVLLPVDLPEPVQEDDEVLIRVCAAGVTPTELLWYPTTHKKDGTARIDVIPGHEFSGVIAALGPNVQGFRVGDEVYGMNDWFANGATAEFCLTKQQNIARKPATLTHEAAATVPIGCLTSWQGLLDRAKIEPRQRVLIHGGTGAVGLFLVQLARLHGAYVIATVSGQNIEVVKQFGADEAIDYKKSRFEDEIEKVDVVFTTVGGDTVDRSWDLLKPGGCLVTIAADSESSSDKRIKDAFLLVAPNHEQLVEIAKLFDSGQLKTAVNAVVPLEDASAAYSGAIGNKLGYGKVVISVQHSSSMRNETVRAKEER
jgi:NADPH:quinone reductase-like Zn-dependent oxidoreductase